MRELLQTPRRDGGVVADPEQTLERLVLLVPYFEMEAWTLQNTAMAIRIANEKYGGRDVKRFDAFAASRPDIDEDPGIASTVLGKEHNRELTAGGYPIEEALAAATSLAALREALGACRALVDALQSLQ